MGYAAVVYLKQLLEENVIHPLQKALEAEIKKAEDFRDKANRIVSGLNKFKTLKDVPNSYLAPLKKLLPPDALGALPHDEPHPISSMANDINACIICGVDEDSDEGVISQSQRISSIVNDLDGINSRLVDFVYEVDAGVIDHPSATLLLQRELANDSLSADQEVKEVITFFKQAKKAAISLCQRVSLLLREINDCNGHDHELVHSVKTAADEAADSIEDLLTDTHFLLEEKDFMKVKSTYNLLKGINQILSHLLKETFSTKRSMKDGLLIKGVDQLPLQTSEEASCSRTQERFIGDDMSKDIDHLPPDAFKVHGSIDLDPRSPTVPTHVDNNIVEDTGSVASPMSVYSRKSSAKQEDIVVGIDDYFGGIIDELTRPPSRLTIVTVVGMGGIGKTTLAKKVFHYPNIVSHFHCLAWVNSVSNVDQVLSDLLKSICPPDDEIHGQSIEDKGEYLWKSLRRRRYLIIIDGLWDFEAWDAIQRFFPEDKVGSRILITSRVMQFPASTGMNISKNPPHYFCMRPLDKNQSWELLEKKLFGKQRCPTELVAVGKQIAEKCEGLPLAIVLIAGTLLNIRMSCRSWFSVLDSITSIVCAKPESCLDIIALSYNYLPHHLKACFLLMGAFPANCDIEFEKLLNLWMAEGFLYSESSKHTENGAENCLKELICRSLVSVGKISLDGKIKTCLLHDLVRQVCLREAQKEKFMHVFESNANHVHGVEKQRHLIFNMDNCVDIPILPPLPHLRSFVWLTLGSGFTPGMVLLQLSCFKWLRVLDMYFLPFDSFPIQILNLVNLRYLALNVTYVLDASISKLSKLQTLKVYGPWISRESEGNPTLFLEFWKMPCLSHIDVWMPCCLLNTCISTAKTSDYPGGESYVQSLSTITFSSCRKEVLSLMPLLKKLGVSETKEDYEKGELRNCFSYLFSLATLETLKCSFYKGNKKARGIGTFGVWSAYNLRKLTLSGSRFSWDNMEVLSFLPNLQTLKLKNGAFQGPEWMLTSERFRWLKHLLIDNTDLMYWKVESEEHFPSLERLVLRNCKSLEKIPWGVGELGVLELIELHYCSESAENSARGYEEKYGSPKVIVRRSAK